jgi:multidrug efflux pump subunit AcrA (membrane-fusion protein)
MIRRLVVSGVVVAAVAGLAATIRPAASAVENLATAPVERGTFIDYLPVRGEIRPERSLVLTAPSAGGGDMQIIQLVTNGATVTAGETVVVFDTTNQQRTLEQKTSELKQAQSELERARTEQQRRLRAAESELAQARSTAARHRLDLDAAELLSKVDAEKRAIAVANADRLVKELEEKVNAEKEIGAADVAIAEKKVEKMRYDVVEAERIIASLALKAPRGGMVSLLPNFRAGGPMSRTSPEFRRGDRAWSGAAIAELPDLSKVRMTLRVDEADRARLTVGGSARVRVDAVPDREFAAAIAEISLVATPDFTSFPPVRNFDVGVTLQESDQRLRSGMSATARIELDRIDNTLMVPASAVLERDGRTFVFVVSDGELRQREITIARRGRERVAIASGVSDGEHVALTPPAAVEEQR